MTGSFSEADARSRLYTIATCVVREPLAGGPWSAVRETEHVKSDWDAVRYQRLSDPQLGWGRRVLLKLAPRPGERILDLGCGTGRLTTEVLAAMGSGCVVGLDRSEAMLREAAACTAGTASGPHHLHRAPDRIHLVRGDGAHLPFAGVFDAVFSAATFHWITDHEQLFASIYGALAPGGRLVAQCGGGPNLATLLGRAHTLMESPTYLQWFRGWRDPWNFADVPSTIVRLENAGFTMVHVSLEPAPTRMSDAPAYKDFLSCVCVRHHVDRLPESVRPSFLEALAREAESDDPPFTLDYWRLNLSAVKPAGAERAA
jgi:trans-aconitate 2-methyltransferase